MSAFAPHPNLLLVPDTDDFRVMRTKIEALLAEDY